MKNQRDKNIIDEIVKLIDTDNCKNYVSALIIMKGV